MTASADATDSLFPFLKAFCALFGAVEKVKKRTKAPGSYVTSQPFYFHNKPVITLGYIFKS